MAKPTFINGSAKVFNSDIESKSKWFVWDIDLGDDDDAEIALADIGEGLVITDGYVDVLEQASGVGSGQVLLVDLGANNAVPVIANFTMNQAPGTRQFGTTQSVGSEAAIFPRTAAQMPETLLVSMSQSIADNGIVRIALLMRSLIRPGAGPNIPAYRP